MADFRLWKKLVLAKLLFVGKREMGYGHLAAPSSVLAVPFKLKAGRQLLAITVSQCIRRFQMPHIKITSAIVVRVISAYFSALLGIWRLCNHPVFRDQFHRLEVARQVLAPYKETKGDFPAAGSRSAV